MKLLILSDLHLNFDFEGIKTTEIDYLICLGDFYNIEHSKAEESTPDIEFVFAKLLKKFDIKRDQLIFIPGNHDPQYCFRKGKEYNNAKNLQNTTCQLQQFSVLGTGGSVDSYYVKDNKLAWNGFSGSSLDSLAMENYIDILLSHQGPSAFGTTDINKNPEFPENRIDGGSESVRNWVLEKKPKLVIHGHTHFSRGMLSLGKTLVVNPGAYRDGYYCEIITNKNGFQVFLLRTEQ
eukprot:NODE_1028_length_1973_cov_0.431163.p1 type:complete len:235 gc:universal NODE_1028_length_1973_cov_0.431163:180-884(+)